MPITIAMGSQHAGVMLLLLAEKHAPTQPAPAMQKNTPELSQQSQQGMAKLFKNLDVLFLIKKVELFHELWSELKLGFKQHLVTKHITVMMSEKCVAKLIKAVEALIKKLSEAAQIKFYATALHSDLA